MDQSFSNHKPRKKLKIHLYLKVCGNFHEAESFIRKLKLNSVNMEHISVLGSVAGHLLQDFTGSAACFKHLRPTEIDYLYVPEIGKVFVSGALSSLLLQKIDGKALGSLEGGLEGILNGYGVSHKKSAKYIEYLKQGKCVVIVRVYAQENHKVNNPI